MGSRQSGSYYILQAKNAQELLEKEEMLVTELQSRSLQSLAVSSFVPSLAKQQDSMSQYQKLKPVAQKFFKELKIENSKKLDDLFKPGTASFSVEDFFARSPQNPLRANWLGEIQGQYYSVVNVVGSPDYASLEALQNISVHLVSKAHDLSQILKNLRQNLMATFGWVIVILALFFIFLDGFKGAFWILFPPVISSLATMVISMFLFGYLNLFNVLAVILIFCLGLDYSVFFSQSKGATVATHIGIFISVLSTIGSFGILAFSKTHAVSSFGMSVFIGICLCYFLSPLATEGEHA